MRISYRVLRAVLALALALALVLHVLLISWMLALDAAAEPFSSPLPPAEVHSGVRSVVLMHHKRLPELNATLRRLAEAAAFVPARLSVHIAQSLRRSEASAANATSTLLRELAIELPLLDLWHAPAILPPEDDGPDGSYTVDAKKFGTKKNSFRNMVRGLDAVFAAAAPPPAYAIVMEDDVEVSLDVLAYFDAAAGLIDAAKERKPPGRVSIATSFCILRRPHPDYGHKGWLPGDWLPLRADRYRRLPLRDLTFKTFAWLAPREVYETMRRDTKSMFALPGGHRALHASLAGCPYCDNFCYDHYIEWRFRNESVVCPEFPRSRQYVLRGGGGMTERPGTVDEYHAKERSGTLLSDDGVHSWQLADASAMAWVKMGDAAGAVSGIFGVLFVALLCTHQHMKMAFRIHPDEMVQGDVRLQVGATDVDISTLEAGFGSGGVAGCASPNGFNNSADGSCSAAAAAGALGSPREPLMAAGGAGSSSTR